MIMLSSEDIYRNLSYEKCIELMQICFEDLGKGLIGMYPKHAAPLPDKNSLLGVMSAYETKGTFAMMKSIGLFKSDHKGVISLYDYKRGELIALFDAASITSLRTASVSALATKYLARPEANTLSLIGAGEQSFHQAMAISKIRNIKEINIFNRTADNSNKLKLRLIKSGILIPINALPLSKIKEVSKEFDIISISTSSKTPILKLHDLPKNCHINSIGACTPNTIEIDPDIINNSNLIVDDIGISKFEAGNLINSTNKRFEDNIKELKNIITSPPLDRYEGTLFNSTGIGVQDLYCAIHLYKQNIKLQNIAEFNIDLGAKDA